MCVGVVSSFQPAGAHGSNGDDDDIAWTALMASSMEAVSKATYHWLHTIRTDDTDTEPISSRPRHREVVPPSTQYILLTPQ